MKTIPALLTAGILLPYDGIRAGTPDGTCGATGISPQVSAFGDPLVATDALGRELPNYAQTGGEKPLCPFWHCLKPEIEKHDKTREEAVK